MTNKIALVTGGASGIGLATVKLLAKRGNRVVVADRNRELLDNTVSELTAAGCDVFGMELDVTDRADCVRRALHLRAAYGSVSVVVNCAGVAGKSQIGDENSGAGWDRNIGINLTGSYNVIAAWVDQLKVAENGAIVNISSVVGLRSGLAEVGYAASKGGVLALTRQLCRELAPFGIRVNCIAPGYIETPMLQGNLGNMQGLMDIHCPMRRLGQPDEIAEAIAFLASDAASYISGATLPVDGGYLCI
ncbi:SDR family NAD(P)-dependent oxidoreductase [Noviherbaspirillum sedimenti]|nr:SDR family NAD(P)-dependent oxidoreductase [Noviherbaspirillum sedimenti]